MQRRAVLLAAVPMAALVALTGCASGPVPGDRLAYVRGVGNDDQKLAHAQFEQQLATLTVQLAASFNAGRVQRIAVLPFESTTDRNAEAFGAYLTEKITNLLYAGRVGTVVERTFLNKVMDEIARGYSGPFDPLSFKEIGHLLNADTLVLGSYTKLNNGMTEVMARAVSVETGEVVGAAATAVSSNLVPNGPIIDRRPLLVQNESLPSGSGGQPLDGQTSGAYSAVPSPGMGYSAFSSYPPPQTGIPLYPYNYVPGVIAPWYSLPPRVIVPTPYGPGTWHAPAPPAPATALFRPRGAPGASSRSSGSRSHKR